MTIYLPSVLVLGAESSESTGVPYSGYDSTTEKEVPASSSILQLKHLLGWREQYRSLKLSCLSCTGSVKKCLLHLVLIPLFLTLPGEATIFTPPFLILAISLNVSVQLVFATCPNHWGRHNIISNLYQWP